MSTYESTCFGISIEFPETWTCQIRANADNWVKLACDDIAVGDALEKELFYSFKRVKDSPTISSCSAGMAVFYREKDFDFASERKASAQEMIREAGIVNIGDIVAKYLYLELQFEKYQSRRKFIYWQARPRLWLNFAMEGDTLENYTEAARLFSRLKIKNT